MFVLFDVFVMVKCLGCLCICFVNFVVSVIVVWFDCIGWGGSFVVVVVVRGVEMGGVFLMKVEGVDVDNIIVVVGRLEVDFVNFMCNVVLLFIRDVYDI